MNCKGVPGPALALPARIFKTLEKGGQQQPCLKRLLVGEILLPLFNSRDENLIGWLNNCHPLTLQLFSNIKKDCKKKLQKFCAEVMHFIIFDDYFFPLLYLLFLKRDFIYILHRLFGDLLDLLKGASHDQSPTDKEKNPHTHTVKREALDQPWKWSLCAKINVLFVHRVVSKSLTICQSNQNLCQIFQ